MADDPVPYYRRRLDELIDDRLKAITEAQRETSRKVDRLEARLNWIAGGLAILSVLANFLGPIIIERLTK